jgi:hypothetical protein
VRQRVARYELPPEPRAPLCGPAGLWTRRDLLRLTALVGLGALGLFFGWHRSARAADWHDDAPAFVLAVGSVTLGGLGLLLWLVVGRLRILAAQRAVASALTRRTGRAPQAVGRSAVGQAPLVTAAGMLRLHRPSCLLVIGKPTVPVTARQDEAASCGVCGS